MVPAITSANKVKLLLSATDLSRMNLSSLSDSSVQESLIWLKVISEAERLAGAIRGIGAVSCWTSAEYPLSPPEFFALSR